MRAKEFIFENNDSHKSSMSNMHQWCDIENSPYKAYRFGVTMAGEPIPIHQSKKESEKGQKLTTFGYTDEDYNIAQRAGKKLGHKSKKLSERGSTETDDVYKNSPIKAFSGF